jgi:hypothetical protein
MGNRPAICIDHGARVCVIGVSYDGRVIAIHGDQMLFFYRDELDKVRGD